MNRYRCILLCVLLLAGTQARADHGISVCTDMTNPDARLACNDKAACYQLETSDPPLP